MGFRLISRGERYKNDIRKSEFNTKDRIDLDYVTEYELDCATPPDSVAKSHEIRNDLKITIRVPKSEYKNESLQNLLKWLRISPKSDYYYRDLAICSKAAGDNCRTVLFSHARITVKERTNTRADYVMVEILAKQKEDKLEGAVIGDSIESAYAEARHKIENPRRISSMVEFVMAESTAGLGSNIALSAHLINIKVNTAATVNIVASTRREIVSGG